MNKRQLKKISKKVAHALRALGYEDFHFNGSEYFFDFEFAGWEMEHTEYSKDALQILWDWFLSANIIQNPDEDDDEFPEILVYPKGFNSLSEINQIHFMIDLLGAIND